MGGWGSCRRPDEQRLLFIFVAASYDGISLGEGSRFIEIGRTHKYFRNTGSSLERLAFLSDFGLLRNDSFLLLRARQEGVPACVFTYTCAHESSRTCPGVPCTGMVDANPPPLAEIVPNPPRTRMIGKRGAGSRSSSLW